MYFTACFGLNGHHQELKKLTCYRETSVLAIIFGINMLMGGRRSVVVKALCYKPEGRGFETRLSERFLSIYLILPAALGPGIYSASNRNEYQKHKNNVSGD
jgi:hypothetical protein